MMECVAQHDRLTRPQQLGRVLGGRNSGLPCASIPAPELDRVRHIARTGIDNAAGGPVALAILDPEMYG